MQKEPPLIQMGVSRMMVDHKPTSQEYPAIYQSFENQTLEPIDLTLVIANGQCFGNCSGEPRSADTWTMAQFVGVDLEKHPNAHQDIAIKNPFYRMYGYLSYPTLSHQWDDPRCRLVFLLEDPVDDRELHHWGARAIAEMFSPAADLSSADRGRAFLGNPNASIVVNGMFLDNPTFVRIAVNRERHAKEMQRANERRYSSTVYAPMVGREEVARTLAKWCDDIANTREGSRNAKLNRAAFLAGKFLLAKGGDERTMMDTLVSAGMRAGLSEMECIRTVDSGFRRGKQAARL